MADHSPRPRKPSLAERRARRAAVEDPAEVVDAAARFLEARPRSVAEVRRRLTMAGYRPDLVEGAIGRLGELGYLDDEAFATAWVESRDRAHPRGRHALREELRLKGVDREVIERVLDARAETAEEPDLAAAERLVARNRAALDRIADPRRRRARAYALLARHGFDPAIAGEVARRAAAPDALDLEPGGDDSPDETPPG